MLQNVSELQCCTWTERIRLRQMKNYFWFPVNTTSASEELKPLKHTCG